MEHTKIIDDKYTSVTNDIEKIQTKPNVYISYTGSRAYQHLVQELVNNVFDEYLNENNISNFEFTIIFDKMDNMVYLEDNGRGIPFEELENACTILHSGSKMHREHGHSAGENGVGLTATNALSEKFEITSYRNNQMRCLQFMEGKKISDNTTKIRKDKHGLLVGFKPSTMFLGKCTLDVDILDTWLKKIIFLQKNEKIKVKFIIRENGKDVTDTKIYQNTKGIGGFLAELEPEANLLKTPVVLSGKALIMENNIPIRSEDGSVNLIDMERTIDLDVVMNYKPDMQETIKYSFCNDIENIEHGEHTNGVLNAIVAFFKKKMKEESKKEEEVVNNDILFGLTVMLNMRTDFSTGLFTSQTKHKMDNRNFYEPIRKITTDALEAYFKLPENKRTLMAIISIIKTNIKIRLAVTKLRKNIKKQKTFLESSIIAGYYPPNRIDAPPEKNPNGCEIYVVEGDSAGSNARMGRYNPDVQGVVGLGGKPSNALNYPPNTDFSKVAPDIAMFFDDILGCGYGKHFVLENCRYKRIIIGTDSDVDGGHICGVLVSNIYYLARPLLENGMVYRVITPLYALVDKSGDREKGKIHRELYLYNKEEYFAAYEKKASAVYHIKIDLNDDYVSGSDMRRFLQTNRDYYQTIDVVVRQNTTHPDIIEYIAKHIDDYKETISTQFPELKYSAKDNSIIGGYDGGFHAFIIDAELNKTLHYLHDIIEIGNDGHSHYHLYRMNSTAEPTYLGLQSIYSIMSYCQQQEPAIESRFKGQGELDTNEFKALAMDPHNRSLLRINVLDAESTTETIMDLFSKPRAHVRKKIVEDADISVEDIDN